MINTARLQELVRTNIECLSRHYFPDARRSGNELKVYDSNGDHLASIKLAGDKAGAVYDVQAQKGISFLSLVQLTCNISFPEAAKQIGTRLGVELEDSPPPRHQPRAATARADSRPNQPDSKPTGAASGYLIERGILPETWVQHSVELDDPINMEQAIRRLGGDPMIVNSSEEDKHPLSQWAQALIWFPISDASCNSTKLKTGFPQFWFLRSSCRFLGKTGSIASIPPKASDFST